MCLRPRSVINPSKRISLQGGHQFLMSVPCGDCAECNTKKRNEYFLRSFYHARDTFDRGGYMLFDTLTYCDSELPHISDSFPFFKDNHDFPCFSRRDIRLFLVLLRKRLERAGYFVKSNLTYFLSSEYGTTPGLSHRPHYHVLFYVCVPRLDALTLSAFISECWSHGRTDGLPFQSKQYVLSKRVYRNDTPFATEQACRYVSKYVLKNSYFERIIDDRVDILFQSFEKKDAETKKRIRKELRSLCCQFHLQSQGFGLSALSYNDPSEVFKTGMLKMYDSQYVVKSIPLPTYFSRKLFYELTDDFRGKKVWQLNALGHQYKLQRVEESVRTLSMRFADFYDNISSDKQIILSHLLDGRSWSDFVKYLLFYKGRVHPPFCGSIPSLDVMLYRQHFWDNFSDGAGMFLFNYCGKNDKQFFGDKPTLLNRWLGDCEKTSLFHDSVIPWLYERDSNGNYIKDNKGKVQTFKGYSSISLDDFIRLYVINQSSDYSFRFFDDIYNLYVEYSYLSNFKKQSAYDLKEKLSRLRKDLKNNSLI